MTFSSRSNPRIAASPVALTSLGAVGGARGTAAGALRIFVEFLTTYDRQAVKDLENDLRQVEHAQNNSSVAEVKRQAKLAQVKHSLDEIDRIRAAKLDTAQRAELKRVEALEQSRSKNNRAEGVRQRTILNQLLKSAGLSNNEIQLLANRNKLQAESVKITAAQERAEQRRSARTKDQVQLQNQLSKAQSGRASIGPRLAGLAVGAVGGIVGGAVLGVGFQLAQTALEGLGDKLQDILDPARHAREAIDELGQSVLELAHNSNITLFEAATKKAEELGLASDHVAVSLLEQFAAQSKVNQSVQDYIKFLEAAAHPEASRSQNIEQITDKLIDQARNEGTLKTVLQSAGKSIALVADRTFYAAQATQQYDDLTRQNTATIDENALARRRLADATAFATLAQEALTQALEAAANVQTGAIDKKIDALGDVGPSKKTQRLQDLIDSAQGGSGTSSRNAELRNIAEERAIILLRQRLKLMGANINLEKFSGKFLLEAINAKIEALNKQGQAQDRLNKLLDLQFRMSQRLKRNQGETINDFLERRAQEGRSQLAELAQIRRDDKIAALEDKRDKVQDEVALEELAQRRLDALRQDGTSNHLKNLQKQLEASKKADQKALTAKREALEKEKKAIQDKTQEAIKLASDQAVGETLAALRGANTLEDLALISGRLAGLERAKGTIESLVKAFLIPDFIAAPFLANIEKQLIGFEGRKNKLVFQSTHGHARGGIINLSNARSPFGQNNRLGEEGSEIGVVLSNKVAQILKQDRGGPQQVGPFIIEKSNDPFLDGHRLKRVVKEAMAEI